MSRVHPPERLDQPRDRPEHPPVWVRGGPASYYYSPNKPHIATADEAARRASTSSISSTTGSPSDTRSSSFSFPTTATQHAVPAAFPTTMAGSTTTGRSASTSSTDSATSRSGSQSEGMNANAGGRSRSGSGPGAYLASLFSSGNQPMEHPAAAAGRKGSPSSGRPAFSGLRSQKRDTSDPTYVQRRESWREQTFKPGGDRRFVGKWWDNVIRGDRDTQVHATRRETHDLDFLILFDNVAEVRTVLAQYGWAILGFHKPLGGFQERMFIDIGQGGQVVGVDIIRSGALGIPKLGEAESYELIPPSFKTPQGDRVKVIPLTWQFETKLNAWFGRRKDSDFQDLGFLLSRYGDEIVKWSQFLDKSKRETFYAVFESTEDEEVVRKAVKRTLCL